MRTLITIVHNRGNEHLLRLLKSLMPTLDHFTDIVIVDTGSPKEELERAKHYGQLSAKGFISKQGGFATGAYLSAFKQYPDYDRYMFMHDSMEVKDADWLQQFEGLLGQNIGAVAWVTFELFFDDDRQRIFISQALENKGETNNVSKRGIFGPIFYTSQNALKRLQSLDLLPSPLATEKWQECGWERGWPICFERAGLKLATLNDYYNSQTMDDGDYAALIKYRPHRS